MTSISGFLAVWKARGLSSQTCVTLVKRALVSDDRAAFRALKAGHAGTLDPQAEGILIVGIGRECTRRLDAFSQRDKVYECEAVLGVTTDTREVSGRVLSTSSHEAVLDTTLCDVQRLVDERFVGARLQQPPVYSALHVSGATSDKGSKRAYSLARAATTLDALARLERLMPARRVELHECTVLHWAPPAFRLRMTCGKGFYVRSLVHDIGAALGCGAAVSSLARIAQCGLTRDVALGGGGGGSDVETAVAAAWTPRNVHEAIARAHPILAPALAVCT